LISFEFLEKFPLSHDPLNGLFYSKIWTEFAKNSTRCSKKQQKVVYSQKSKLTVNFTGNRKKPLILKKYSNCRKQQIQHKNSNLFTNKTKIKFPGEQKGRKKSGKNYFR
jgi:hypothetical protein